MSSTKIISSTIKVMQSYDYNHFEVSIHIHNEDGLVVQEIDTARKDAQLLTDKAVGQYKSMKSFIRDQLQEKHKLEELRKEVTRIKSRDKEFWSISEKATVKALDDYDYNSHGYRYDDDENYSDLNF